MFDLKRLLIVLIGTVIVLPCGCFRLPVEPYVPGLDGIRSYQIGKFETSNVGSTMLTYSHGARLFDRFQNITPIVYGSYSIPVGTYWDVSLNYNGSCGEGKWVLTTPDFRQPLGIVIGNDGELPCDDSVISIARPSVVRRLFIQDERRWGFGEKGKKYFKPATQRIENAVGAFKQELVYQGRDSQSMRVLYREYNDDLARPAYSQEVYYDLSVSNSITFKNFQLEIASADNNAVVFKVTAAP